MLRQRIGLFALLACFAALSPAPAAEPVLPVPENLVLDGVPPIPATVAESAAPYTESRPAMLTSWHPTRREVLISTRFGNTNQAHLVKAPGGARTQMTFFPDPVSNAAFEPAKGEYIVFSKGAGGNEFFQLYRMDLPPGRPRC